eukprot:8546344-Lingulodinium_polyedra.AAC.1
MQTPKLAFAWSARGARFASRCGGRRSIRPHHCARFEKPCTTMRSNRLSAAAAARKSHASRTPRGHQNLRSHGAREACDSRAAAAAD